MAYQNQFQKGEDVIFVLKNNNGFDLNDIYSLNAGKPSKFVVHLYPRRTCLVFERQQGKDIYL